MKHIMKEKFKIPYLRKGSYILFLLCTIFFVYMKNYVLDNDTWFLLNHGRYVFEHGIPYIEPFTIHENLSFVMQQWLSALIFYLFYNFFGIKSLLFLIILCNFIIIFLYYKLCMLVSGNNYKISVMVTVVMDLLISFFIVSRPQIFSFILILLLLYCLELYIKTKNVKHLFFLPIVSLLQINLHASMWWMLYIFMLPYLLDGYKVKLFRHDVYKKSPILIAMLVMFLFGLINPYGLDAITYLFHSYGIDLINNFVNEMKPVNVNDIGGKIVYFCIVAIFCINIFTGKNKIKIRYFLLFLGTSYLALSSNKGFSYFILASFFPIAYYLKGMMVLKEEKYTIIYKISFLIGTFGIFLVFCIVYLVSGVEYQNSLDKGINLLLEKYDKSSIKLFVGYNQGGYTEFRGIKSYIDPRAEVFLEANNKKEDIFEEYYQLLLGEIEFKDFLEKYNFTHLLICDSERLYDEIDDIEDYILFYEGKLSDDEKYKIYVKQDV